MPHQVRNGFLALCLVGFATIIAITLAAPPPAHAARPLSVSTKAKQLTRQMRRRGDPKGEIHLALAALYARHGLRKSVLAHLRAARTAGVAAFRVNLTLAEFYRRQARYDAAFSTLVRILVDHPGHPSALLQLWQTLYECQLRQIAVRSDLTTIRNQLVAHGMHFPQRLTLAADAQGRSKSLTASAYTALLDQKPAFSAQLFEAAIDQMPANSRAHRGLGIARTRLGDDKRAAGAYLVYLSLAPDAADAGAVDRLLVRYWRTINR